MDPIRLFRLFPVAAGIPDPFGLGLFNDDGLDLLVESATAALFARFFLNVSIPLSEQFRDSSLDLLPLCRLGL